LFHRLKIYKKLSGSYSQKVDVALPDGVMQQGVWYHLKVTLSGANIKVSWNGQQLINWTDPSNRSYAEKSRSGKTTPGMFTGTTCGLEGAGLG
jgi:hypothetical protein